ncbi:MAG: hypothetical protein R3335_04295 [Anaerolineales bacterium]|nr:hypothetical protein [Anaerolineales bacterium]
MNILILALLFDALFGPLEAPKAYLDPGSGSILLQLIAAAALGGLIVLRTQWARIRGLFGRPPAEEDDDDDFGDDDE